MDEGCLEFVALLLWTEWGVGTNLVCANNRSLPLNILNATLPPQHHAPVAAHNSMSSTTTRAPPHTTNTTSPPWPAHQHQRGFLSPSPSCCRPSDLSPVNKNEQVFSCHPTSCLTTPRRHHHPHHTLTTLSPPPLHHTHQAVTIHYTAVESLLEG